MLLFVLQDAHEFLNFLLNELVDILEKEAQAAKNDAESSSPSLSPEKTANGPKIQASGVHKELLATWVHKNFQVGSLSDFMCMMMLV